MRILALAILLAAAPDEGLTPWAGNKHASDTPKQQKEEITKSKQPYTVVQGGTMDGRNCRSPLGCGMSRDPASKPYFDRSKIRPGMVTPAVIAAFRSIGWGWGGSWSGDTKDYMHFSSTGH